jgi:hypothetical protein
LFFNELRPLMALKQLGINGIFVFRLPSSVPDMQSRLNLITSCSRLPAVPAPPSGNPGIKSHRLGRPSPTGPVQPDILGQIKTQDEAFSILKSLAASGSAFYVIETDGRRWGGSCQITNLSQDGFTVVRFGGFITLSCRLGALGLHFEGKSPLSFPPDEQKAFPAAALTSSGLLICAPNGESLFLIGTHP